MKMHHRQLLISALASAFAIKFSQGFDDDCAAFAPHTQGDDKITLYSGPSVATTFEPISGISATNASITFEIEFKNCTFNHKTENYEWDGQDYGLRFGEYAENLSFANCVGAAGDKDWTANCIKDFGEEDDVAVSKAVLQKVFAVLSEEDKTAFLRAVFNETIKATEIYNQINKAS